MKYLLFLFPLALTSCATTQVDPVQLEKAGRFAQCVNGCYQSVYGPGVLNLPEE